MKNLWIGGKRMKNLWIDRLDMGNDNITFVIRDPDTAKTLVDIPEHVLRSAFISKYEKLEEPKILTAWEEPPIIHIGLPVEHPPYRISFYEIEIRR